MSRQALFLLVFAILLGGLPALATSSVLEIPAALTTHEKAVSIPPPFGHEKALATEPMASLTRADYAAPEKLEEVRVWNAEKRFPAKVGFVRPMGETLRVELGTGSPKHGRVDKSGDATVWSGSVFVEGAHRIRLRLSEVKLPAGTELWVSGAAGEVVPFGLELLRQEGDLWTPSVGGDRIFLQVRVPSSATPPRRPHRFVVDSVSETFRLDGQGAPVTSAEKVDSSCLMDAACFTNSTLANLDVYKEAVAHLQFIDGGSAFICSGGLVNDTDSSGFIPYLLTANHCFSSQSATSTLEAFFDYIAPSCGGTWPALGTLPRVLGGSLLATTANTDSTFVRLSNNPSGSTGYLGWTTSFATNNTGLFRLSHPFGWAQAFSRSSVEDPSTFSCTGVSINQFIYSAATLGGTAGGSSGSPTVDDQMRIRGQLLGACGLDPENPCSVLNNELDGRLSEFFPSIENFLNPPDDACIESETALCLNDTRFKLEGRWRNFVGEEGDFQAVPFTEDSGLFWFFVASNVEFLVKVIDGCGFNNHFWVFAAATTDVEYTLTVTDTLTGATATYSNPLGNAAAAITDTSAFATCP